MCNLIQFISPKRWMIPLSIKFTVKQSLSILGDQKWLQSFCSSSTFYLVISLKYKIMAIQIDQRTDMVTHACNLALRNQTWEDYKVKCSLRYRAKTLSQKNHTLKPDMLKSMLRYFERKRQLVILHCFSCCIYSAMGICSGLNETGPMSSSYICVLIPSSWAGRERLEGVALLEKVCQQKWAMRL